MIFDHAYCSPSLSRPFLYLAKSCGAVAGKQYLAAFAQPIAIIE